MNNINKKNAFSMQEPEEENVEYVQPVKKSGKAGYIFMSLMALAFAIIITKDIVVPGWILYTGAAVGAVVLMVKGMSEPALITYVLVAYMPFSKILVGDFGKLSMAFNVTNMLIGFILVTWFNGKYAQGEPLWTKSPLNGPIIAFILLGLLSLIRASYYDTGYWWPALIEFKRWVTPIFLFFLVLNTVKDRLMIRNIVIIMIVVTTIVGLMAIYDYIDHGDAGDLENARIGGICEHSNSLAAFFVYYMFLPLGIFLMNTKKSKAWLLILPFLIQFRGIMVTFSRGGYLACAAGLYAITFFRSKMLFILLLFLTAFMVMNPVLLPSGIRYRMGQTFTKSANTSYAEATEDLEGNLEASSAIRIKIWKGAAQMIKEHPVFGVGYGLFPVMLTYYVEGLAMDAHNTYLIIAAEMGLPTLFVFLLICMVAIFQTWCLYREARDPFTKAFALGYLGGLFGLMVGNMFGSRLDSQEVSAYFWILNALVMRLRIIEKRERVEKKVEARILDTVPWFERKLSY